MLYLLLYCVLKDAYKYHFYLICHLCGRPIQHLGFIILLPIIAKLLQKLIYICCSALPHFLFFKSARKWLLPSTPYESLTFFFYQTSTITMLPNSMVSSLFSVYLSSLYHLTMDYSFLLKTVTSI